MDKMKENEIKQLEEILDEQIVTLEKDLRNLSLKRDGFLEEEVKVAFTDTPYEKFFGSEYGNLMMSLYLKNQEKKKIESKNEREKSLYEEKLEIIRHTFENIKKDYSG